MRTNVAQDATVLVGVPEPVGPAGSAARISRALKYLMWSDVDCLNHLADRALLHQLTRVHCGLHFEPFAVHDGVDALRLCNRPSYVSELFECGDAWLV